MPTWEICCGVVFGAGFQSEVGDGGRLWADGDTYHVLHLVHAVSLEPAPGQLSESLALPDQDQSLWKIFTEGLLVRFGEFWIKFKSNFDELVNYSLVNIVKVDET